MLQAARVKGGAFIYVIIATYPSLLAKLKLSCLYALLRGLKSAHKRPCNSCLPFLTSKIKACQSFSTMYTQLVNIILIFSFFPPFLLSFSLSNISLFNISLSNISLSNISLFNFSLFNFSLFNFSLFNISLFNISLSKILRSFSKAFQRAAWVSGPLLQGILAVSFGRAFQRAAWVSGLLLQGVLAGHFGGQLGFRGYFCRAFWQ